ncbi:MAG: LacI family DNA-binding transcriptional regulator [Devosia sp.]|nr:LacI family DNA-binding transcriptional regulator [Devosia sp.]
MPERESITIREVAAAAGVSIATVSRVVNGYRHVRPEVRARVQRVIAELGYRGNRLASSFRTQQSRIVGVFLRQQQTPFSSALGYAVESTMFDEGYRTLLCSTIGDPDREESYVQTMIEMRAEGVIIRPTAATSRTVRHVALLRQAGIAVVFADTKPRIPSVSAIVCDNFSGGYEGMRHLLGLGHRWIGVIAGEQIGARRGRRQGSVGVERVYGMEQASRTLASGVELFFSEPFAAASVELGAAEAERLLTAHPEITAIFATTDILAIGAMQTAHRLGIRIPDELSILGYDGVMESAITFPALTTVRQPIHEMGELAARTLLTHIRQPDAPVQQVVLENSLLLRASTSPARTNGPL